MTTLPKALRRNLLAAAVGLSLSAPITLQAAQNDVVLLWGTQTEGELMMGFEGFGQSAAGVTPAQACFLARHFIEMNLPMPPGEFYMMVAMMAGQMGGMEGMRAAAGALADLNACADDPAMGSSGGIWR